MSSSIDLLIEPDWVIPVEPADITLKNHALAVDQGRILDLLPVGEATNRYTAKQHLRLTGEALIPGLVNVHTHAAMSLLRGFADDLPLKQWLTERIWPAEQAHVSSDFVYDGTLLAAWEMLRGGITCFGDMYFYPAAAGHACIEAGIRAALGVTVIEFPTAYAADAADHLAKGLATRDALCDEPLISFTLAPHAPYTVSDRTFEQIGTLAAQLDIPIHIHLHETSSEIEESLTQHGVRPIERLRRLGMVAPNLIAVHAVHLTPQEIDLLIENGCSIAHCPTSNLKLASGIAPIAQIAARCSQQSSRIALGTDGAASNNRLDILREMRQASLLAKVASHDASALPAHEVLRMATLNGAAALGLDNVTGSLVPGKWADLCSIRLDDWPAQPCFDPVSHIVHVLGREHVQNVWVAGKQRIDGGRPIDVPTSHLSAISHSWHNRLAVFK